MIDIQNRGYRKLAFPPMREFPHHLGFVRHTVFMYVPPFCLPVTHNGIVFTVSISVMLHSKLLLFLKLTVLVFWLLIKVVLVPKRRLTLSCILLFFSTYLQPWRGFNRSRYLDLFLKGFSQTINLIQNKYFKKYLKILNCQIITKDLSWCKRWNRFPKMILKGIVWKFITFLRSICPQTLVHTSMYMFSVFIGICEQSRYIFCSTFYVLRSSIDSITS